MLAKTSPPKLLREQEALTSEQSVKFASKAAKAEVGAEEGDDRE